MSKLHMRARKLDYTRRLHVYRSEEVLDLDDQTQFARSVPVVATGVEKEEEEVCACSHCKLPVPRTDLSLGGDPPLATVDCTGSLEG